MYICLKLPHSFSVIAMFLDVCVEIPFSCSSVLLYLSRGESASFIAFERIDTL